MDNSSEDLINGMADIDIIRHLFNNNVGDNEYYYDEFNSMTPTIIELLKTKGALPNIKNIKYIPYFRMMSKLGRVPDKFHYILGSSMSPLAAIYDKYIIYRNELEVNPVHGANHDYRFRSQQSHDDFFKYFRERHNFLPDEYLGKVIEVLDTMVIT